MSIYGIGIDLVEVARMKKILTRDTGLTFRKKVFSDREIEYCEQGVNSAERYSARFAAKEAFIKAFVETDIPLNEIMVEKKKNGNPYFIFGENVLKRIKKRKVTLSLTHTRSYASAVVVIEE